MISSRRALALLAVAVPLAWIGACYDLTPVPPADVEMTDCDGGVTADGACASPVEADGPDAGTIEPSDGGDEEGSTP